MTVYVEAPLKNIKKRSATDFRIIPNHWESKSKAADQWEVLQKKLLCWKNQIRKSPQIGQRKHTLLVSCSFLHRVALRTLCLEDLLSGLRISWRGFREWRHYSSSTCQKRLPSTRPLLLSRLKKFPKNILYTSLPLPRFK